MTVTVKNGRISDEEKQAYIDRAKKKYPDSHIESMTITLDGEFADIVYTFTPIKFDRIRRITGYLVGTLDRFNNAKRAEVNDRVKHG